MLLLLLLILQLWLGAVTFVTIAKFFNPFYYSDQCFFGWDLGEGELDIDRFVESFGAVNGAQHISQRGLRATAGCKNISLALAQRAGDRPVGELGRLFDCPGVVRHREFLVPRARVLLPDAVVDCEHSGQLLVLTFAKNGHNLPVPTHSVVLCR